MKKYITILLAIILLLLSSCTDNTNNNTDNTNNTGNIIDDVGNDEETDSDNNNIEEMTFFVTSENPGNGADFGGIEGADRHCESLANSVGADNYEWKAYLSTQSINGSTPINARDRIGEGPWHNASGVLIANNIEELHSNNNINKQTALDENGETVMGRGDEPNLHDILTGSMPDGTASGSTTDTTCNNWTSSGSGTALVGHHDKLGLDETDAAKSWNSSHLSRGCSLDLLALSGGGGLIYCFGQ